MEDEYRNGKTELINYFIGQVLRKTQFQVSKQDDYIEFFYRILE